MRLWSTALTVLLATLVVCGCDDHHDARRQFLAGDYEHAFKSFSRLADTGDSAAINFVGIHYYLGLGVQRDLARAAQLFEQAALASNADAQRNLGVLYLRGWGVAKDNVHAYGWLSQAERDGNKRAREYLQLVETQITPNQIMQARVWVADQLHKADPHQ